MPLKHFTETFLVVVLGAVIALTGLLVSTLPDLPDGALPWAVIFVLTVIYPLSLHSLFQRRRADNLFRNLHWFPAAIALVWLLLQGIAIGSSVDASSLASYTWGWTIGPVVLGFVLLVSFCLKVIRRRTPRLTFLALILIPFAAAAFMSEQGGNWEKELASAMWSADFWKLDDTGLIASLTKTDESMEEEKNLDPSEDPDEENWRERLRMQKNREERIAARMEDRSEDSSEMAKEKSSSSSSSTANDMAMASVSSKPSTLPKSGFGWNMILITMAGAYCATVHNSARKRVES